MGSLLSFFNQPLLWGLLILGVPILIHLINLMRHKRIPWAAMEFLLVSQKKNSRWIRLKELLLLLLRLAAIAAIVMIVARPLLNSQFARWFGAGRTHHIVLLDDSFSMSDRFAERSAFQDANQVIRRIAEQAALQSAQSFSLLRFSRAGRAAGGTKADMLQELVDSRFAERVENLLRTIEPSQFAAGPGPALKAVEQMIGERGDENRIVYVVSDFRAGQWDEPGDVSKSLARLNDAKAQIHLINCVDATHGNLSLVSLVPQRRTRAAGIPLSMDVTVANHGGDVVRGVSVLVEEDGNARPAVEIDQIAPGQSETRTFPVFFATGGTHLIKASLAADTVLADNTRYSMVQLPASLNVLIIDSDPDTAHARFFATALAPGGTAKTGIVPRIESPGFLNNQPLSSYDSIFLLNIDRLDVSAIDALEAYTKAGGGIGFFLGERSTGKFFTDKLYRDGQGLFPLPLVGDTPLLVDRLDKGADLEVTDHPVFKIFAGERNSFLAAVTVERYFTTSKNWAPKADSTVKVVARLRNGAPLAVERQYGEGRVMAMLTTAAPVWNNWGRNPSYVVMALEMQSYLGSHAAVPVDRLVGTPIELSLDPAQYNPAVRFIVPGAGLAGALSTQAVEKKGALRASFDETSSSGVYDVQLSRHDSQGEERQFAYNVDAAEGDLSALDGEQLARRLKDIRYEYRLAADFRLARRDLAGSDLSEWILYALIFVLIGEQILAYVVSYHPPRPEAARR